MPPELVEICRLVVSKSLLSRFNIFYSKLEIEEVESDRWNWSQSGVPFVFVGTRDGIADNEPQTLWSKRSSFMFFLQPLIFKLNKCSRTQAAELEISSGYIIGRSRQNSSTNGPFSAVLASEHRFGVLKLDAGDTPTNA